jgi:hypothetical protein
VAKESPDVIHHLTHEYRADDPVEIIRERMKLLDKPPRNELKDCFPPKSTVHGDWPRG